MSNLQQIEQIRLGVNKYDINVQKDWEENDPSNVGYIKNRTHYFERVPGADLVAQGVSVSHTFINYYDSVGEAQKIDTWDPGVSWISRQIKATEDGNSLIDVPGCYRIVVSLGANTFAELPNITLPLDSQATVLQGQNITNASDWANFELIYTADNKFKVTGEPISNNKSEDISITIYPAATTSDGKRLWYTYAKCLDAQFIPVDQDSIKRSPDGKLYVDTRYTSDFDVTYDFGKYIIQADGKPRTVPATGKTIQEVLQDAFCENRDPTNNEGPRIEFTATNSGTHEVGTELNVNYTLYFNRGKYEYGVVKGDSTRVNLTSDAYATSYTISGGDDNISSNANDNLDEAVYINDTYSESKANSNRKKQLDAGTIAITLNEPDKTTRLTASINYEISDEDIYRPRAMLGTAANIQVPNGFKSSDSLSATSGTYTTRYRYFWGYKSANETLYDMEQKTFSRDDFGSSQLAAFPATISTTNAQQWYFAYPDTASNQNKTFELLNSATNAPAGLEVKSRSIQLKDAGGVVDRAYKLVYIENAGATDATTEYKVVFQ
jgi:hypothetical protein